MSVSLWCGLCHAGAQYWHVSDPSKEKLEKIQQNVHSISDLESTPLKISSSIYFFKHFKASSSGFLLLELSLVKYLK